MKAAWKGGRKKLKAKLTSSSRSTSNERVSAHPAANVVGELSTTPRSREPQQVDSSVASSHSANPHTAIYSTQNADSNIVPQATHVRGGLGQSPQADDVTVNQKTALQQDPSTDLNPATTATSLVIDEHDKTPLNASPLWRRAYQSLADDPNWKSYIEVVHKNANLANNKIDSSDTIITIAEELSKQIESSKSTLRLAGRTIVIRNILDKGVEFLAVLKDVGAAATALNPYAAVAWGGLQFFVQAAITAKEVRSLCWDELPRIVRLISQYQTFEHLYDVSDLKLTRAHLENALVNLFTAILKYQIEIVRYANLRMGRIKAAFQGTASSLPQKILDEVSQCEQEVLRLQSTADREITDAKFQLIAESMGETQKRISEAYVGLRDSLKQNEAILLHVDTRVDDIYQLLEDFEKNDILDWISTEKVSMTYVLEAHNAKEFLPGTGDWLLEDPTYLAWQSSKTPSILWLHGHMGTGKSCLAHIVIEKIRENAITRGLAYFYCKVASKQSPRISSETVLVEDVLRCILQQLLDDGNEVKLMKGIEELYNTIHRFSRLSAKQCADFLLAFVNGFPSTVLIIDGLDECLPDVQQKLMKHIVDLLEAGTRTVKVFVSSQHNRWIRDLFPESIATEIEVTAKRTREDIDKVIAAKAEKAATDLGTRIFYREDSENLKADVIKKIKAKAAGMFLWVDLAFTYIHREPVLPNILRERLKELDKIKSLFSLYDKLYESIMDRLEEPYRHAVVTLLQFMLYGFGSQFMEGDDGKFPDLAYVIEACTFVGSSKGAYSARTAEALEALCPNLAILTRLPGNQQVFSFPHPSVREWLMQRSPGDFSEIKGHSYLAQLCMRVLMTKCQEKVSDDDAEENESESLSCPLISPALERYSFQGWLDHCISMVTCARASKKSINVWSKDVEIRNVLENFLFGSTDAEEFPALANSTVFQHWHLLGQGYGSDDSDNSSNDGSSDDSSDALDQDFMGFPGVLKPKLSSYLEERELPDALRKYHGLPTSLISPVFICALLGYHCDLSRYTQAVLDVHPNMRDESRNINWQTRSLTAVMETNDVQATEWLIGQWKLSCRVLAEALVLKFSVVQQVDSTTADEEERMQVHMSQLSKLLRNNSLDFDTLCGTPERDLLIHLINITRRRNLMERSSTDIAIMVASLVNEGANVFVPIYVPIDMENADFDTLFHWILSWKCHAAITDVALPFLNKDKSWEPEVLTRWLFLALESEYDPSGLVQALLELGADPLLAPVEGQLPLQIALEDCGPTTVERLSLATFEADINMRADRVDPSGIYFKETILPTCSKSTIELWEGRGARLVSDKTEPGRYNTDDRDGNKLEELLDTRILIKIELRDQSSELLTEWESWLKGANLPRAVSDVHARPAHHELFTAESQTTGTEELNTSAATSSVPQQHDEALSKFIDDMQKAVTRLLPSSEMKEDLTDSPAAASQASPHS